MKESVEIVDSDRLDKLLEYIYDFCLICPEPYDYNQDEYEGLPCPDIDCTLCWHRYLSADDGTIDAMTNLMRLGKIYRDMRLK